MYVAGAGGGVWKTGTWTDAPDVPPTWLPLGDGERSLDVGGYHPLVVHPANHALILVAVSGAGAGVLKSTNGGFGWQLLGNSTFEGGSLGSIAVHPTNTQILYVSVWNGGPGAGVYKSTDGGLNWTNTTSFHDGWVSDVIVARFDPQVLFAGLISSADGAGINTSAVYRTDDGGANWDAMVGTGLPSNFFLGSAVRLESAYAQGTVYTVVFENELEGGTLVGRYRTRNGGDSWTKLEPTPGTPELRSWHLVLAIHPEKHDHVLVNDAYVLFESEDGGKTWTQAETIGDDWVNAVFAPQSTLVVTADRNVYRYHHSSNSWLEREGNLALTQFYDITLDLQDPDRLYGVGQDHPDAMRFGGSILWSYLPKGGGETGKVLVDPTNSDLLYVSHPLDPANLVQRSNDGGQNWTTVLSTQDFEAEDYDLAYTTQKAFVMDPSSPSRLLLGTTKILETTDGGNQWSEFAGVLSSSNEVSDQYVTAVAVSDGGQSVYAATGDGHVWLKRPNKFWEQTDKGLFDQNAGRILDLRVNPDDPERAFAVTPVQGGVWYLRRNGPVLEWLNVEGDLPGFLRPVSILPDWRYSTPPLYLGTSRGVYHSVDLGAHWTEFGKFLPRTVVTDLQALPDNDVLAAGTFGRGVWEILTSASRISGRVFEDLNGDGKPDRGEPGMAGVRIFLDASRNAARGEHDLTATTDADGRFVFDRVPPGTYAIRQITPTGYVQTLGPAPVAVAGSDLTGMDFGNTRRVARQPTDAITVADLDTLPGRRPGQPLGAPGEFVHRHRQKQ